MNVSATKLAVFILLVLISLPAFAQATPPALNDIDVALSFDAANNKIIVTTNGNCAQNNTVGCFETPKSEYTRLRFEIPAPASNKWFLKKIGICKTANSAPPCGPLTKWERAEFIATKPGADALLHPDSNGAINLPGQSASVNLYIMNNIAQDWWYSLQACRRNNPSTCTDLDPQIRNKGRN